MKKQSGSNVYLLVQLAAAGITDTTVYYRRPETDPVPSYLTDIYDFELVQLWAKSKNISLSISGEVIEWQYDEQNRFFTILQLKVADIASGEEIWSANGVGEGLPREEKPAM